jgi:hypothetical protein
MEELVRCEERERARSTQAWGEILTSTPEAAQRRWDRLAQNLRPPQAAFLAHREAQKWSLEKKTGREARGNKPNEAVDDPCRGRDPRPASIRRIQCDDFATSCTLPDRQTSKMIRRQKRAQDMLAFACPSAPLYQRLRGGATGMPIARAACSLGNMGAAERI